MKVHIKTQPANSQNLRPSRRALPVGVLLVLFVLPVLLFGLGGCASAAGEIGTPQADTPVVTDTTDPDPKAGRLEAFAFPEDAEWVNVDEPLSMDQLKGRYVLLDFWTYGCINCYHMIPNLNALHQRYDGRLTVVGVHSAKFTEEQQTKNIREAIQRYDIRYPVVNDREMELWRRYGVRGWPTIILIDPDGYVIGGTTGEWDFDRLAGLLDQTIDADPDSTPPALPQLEQAAQTTRPATRLTFPQGLTYAAATETLYVSDTGNNRILQVDADTGTVTAAWGTGVAGLRDGNAESARFNGPRGLTVYDGSLYVADTDNHAIRKIELASRNVTTVVQGGVGPDQEVRSPWDIATDGRRLYFSNAGQHQIWTVDPKSGEAARYSGSGWEGLTDGPNDTAEFAQPSGLSFADGILYVADPESSAVRAVDTRAHGEVTTLAGAGLFDFGDVDGSAQTARLMHVGDVEYTAAGVVLADTYNNSLRIITDGVVRTINRNLNEPKALATDGDRIWIADTNNHRIVRTDLSRIAAGSGEVDTVSLRPGGTGGAAGPSGDGNAPLSFRQDLAGGSLRLEITLPAGHKLNEESPNSMVFRSAGGDEVVLPVKSAGTEKQVVTVPWKMLSEAGVLDAAAGRQSVIVESWLYYCRQDNEEVCRFFSTEVQLLLEAGAGGAGTRAAGQPPAGEIPDAVVPLVVG